ncbi:Hsp20/alpha crystallin family protein [Rickettsia typhi]|uniref:Small heat shock protein C1 n=2 Tax=Rickettsia typhi TaxID=785 RepID=HSPC1_RICTY|nr:Hsp20/alpha crystallin family protein [Rickettsia typhi]Q68X97.1 RecName: Full=Small heat shock protein C1 [Rickettsia typhi str. Wilmington]AAU03745.1 HSP22-like heat shock protein [Rickettsia typhi str. Wilmington]AFE54122.1 small heat shock protein [Rickettsia typhi str. TH1527]AFE54961.1 small heat shock protein [Rickettsia typhi str. B9991CWPP]
MLKYIPAIFAIILSSNIAIASKNYDYINATPLRQVADLIDSHITNIDHLFNNRLMFYESSSIKSKFITKDKQYVIIMEVPGFDKNQIKVKLNGKKLFIAGNIEEKNKANDSDNYMNKNFNYVISLYEDVDQTNISARLKNGILTIILPRIEVKEQDAKEITIN